MIIYDHRRRVGRVSITLASDGGRVRWFWSVPWARLERATYYLGGSPEEGDDQP